MRTYSLITKPYRIMLRAGMKHTLMNPLTNKGIEFEGGTKFWCAKAYSQDHTGYKSLILFNHSFYTTFALGSKKLQEKWVVIDSNEDWRNELSVLQVSLLALNLFTDGTIPSFVPKESEYNEKV